MLKNKILLAFVALVFGTTLKAQIITIDNARLLGALPVGASYGSGGTVAVPIQLNGCFAAPSNVFTWTILNAANTKVDSGKVNVFYATFINVNLPASLPTGLYKVEIKSTTAGSIPVTTIAFPVVNTGASPVIAKVNPIYSDQILLDQYYFGICNGIPLANMDLKDSSTTGGTDSLEVIDEYRGSFFNKKYVPDGTGTFPVLFFPKTKGSKRRDSYYTAFLKTINGNTVSTKGYHLINNSWDVEVGVVDKSNTTQYSCAGDTVTLRFEADTVQYPNLQQNFPAALIRVNWGDGSTNPNFPGQVDYSQCDLLSRGGVVKHFYSQGACTAIGATSFKIVTTVRNPFNIFNGPGLTGTCAAGAEKTTQAYIFSKPKAAFANDSVICAMDTLKFINTSNPGQGPAADGNLSVCANLANYTWVINKDSASKVILYKTPLGKVEGKKDTAYSFNGLQFGYNQVTLYVNNNYQTQAPCAGHDTTKIVCVDTAKVRPMFQLDSAGAGVLRDSIIGCAPVFCIKNMTRRTFCVDSTNFKYKWRVLDALTGVAIPVSAGNYSYTSGNDTSRQPCISLNKTGKYLIELNASATCALDTTLRMRKYVEANGDAGVKFVAYSTTYGPQDTVGFCGYPIPLTIDYNPNAGVNPQLDNIHDSVTYIYQPSTAGSLSYKWSVTKNGSPAVYGNTNDYEFIGGTGNFGDQRDTAAAYPKFRFYKTGLYAVTVLFKNNCQPKTATQYVAYRDILTAVSGGTSVADSVCHTATSFTVTGDSAYTTHTKEPVTNVFWSTTGKDSYFTPANSLSPTFVLGPQDLADACDTGKLLYLTLNVYGVKPSNCSLVSSPRQLFIRPCVALADTSIDGCSGTPVNYSIKKQGLDSADMTWTIINNFGPVNGGNAGNGKRITDVLTGNGYITYQITPTKDGCPGNPYLLTDTVRPIPNVPTINRIKPTNSPVFSMCSGDTFILEMTSTNPTDSFSWISFNHIGKITGMSTGVKQPGSIKDILINNTAPLLVDTAEYCIKTVSKYGCTSAAICSTVVVTPGPNIADIYGSPLKYLCNQSCDTIRHNTPGVAGVGTFSILYPTSGAVPTFTNIDDSTTVVCGMQAGGTYGYQWKVDPVLAGCASSTDKVEIQVKDTLPTPYAGMDTAFCTVNGITQNIATINGSLSRPKLGYEAVYINGAGPISATPTYQYQYYFTNPGTYPIVMTVTNFGACPDKTDTLIVRGFTIPSGGSITANPATSVCQGSVVTLTANYDTTIGNPGTWTSQTLSAPVQFANIGANVNPLLYTANQNVGVAVTIISKGAAYGCTQSTTINGPNIFVDSATIAGKITTQSASDTIVCVPGTIVTLKVINNRGSVREWIKSTTNATTGYGPNFYTGTVANDAVNATTWYRAIVKNGNCGYDTTAPFRIFVPTGADVAQTGNDTAVCGATTITLKGNVPVVGSGYWRFIAGPIQTTAAPAGCVNFGSSPNDTTSQNPVCAHIATYGTYQFVWQVKNLNCDATADTITILNTEPIAGNTIAAAADTVCNGIRVVVTGSAVTGGSVVKKYTWQTSNNGGTTWVTASTAANSYTFTATADVQVRRVIQSDSCYSYSNVINFVVQPLILNDTIIPVFSAVCINQAAPLINGSTPTGGSGIYTYSWYYATNLDTANKVWNNGNTTTKDYTYPSNLTDTLHFIRVVVAGKCTDTSKIATVTVLPDAKANFVSSAPNNNTRCAPYSIGGDVKNIVLPNTNYDWYITTSAGVRTLINSGSQFFGYTIVNGLDSVKLTLIATSTTVPACKSDSMSMMFHTSATPKASFTISTKLGCASNTGTNTTNFVFTNTTPNKALFPIVNWNLNSTTATNSGSIDLPPGGYQYYPSTTGLDTTYTITLTVNSPSCGSSQFSDTIRVRTRPIVNFGINPSYVCSGNSVLLSNATIGSSNLTYQWIFGDAGNTVGSTNADTVSHAYVVNTLTTYCPKLIATNECASDSNKTSNCVTVEANKVTLNFAIDGLNKRQCAPSTVKFYNNSFGGSIYVFDFGDGQQSTPSPKGTDTIIHTYNNPGTYVVALSGSTQCGNVVKYDTVFVYATPNAGFTISPNTTACIGDTVKFVNTTDSATSYSWSFGSSTKNPTRTYNTTGVYNISLIASRNHSLTTGGSLFCSDTTGIQTVTIRDTLPATYTVVNSGTTCVPYIGLFTDNTVIQTGAFSTTWSFDDGTPNVASNGSTTHTYNTLRLYNTSVVIKSNGGCTYTGTLPVIVNGPNGTVSHDTGYICNSNVVNFNINANLTDSVRINFGTGADTTVLYSSLPSTYPNLQHSYPLGGTYSPVITLISKNGCLPLQLPFYGFVRVDYVKAAYDTVLVTPQPCGSTTYNFIDKSSIDQNKAGAVYNWVINGVTYTAQNPSVTFAASGTYNVRMQVTSVSGCYDTVTTTPITVKVNNTPIINSVNHPSSACEGEVINYDVTTALSEDAIVNYNWSFANGIKANGQSTQTIYANAGTYRDTIIVVTDKGCASVPYITSPITINPSPKGVTITPGSDTLICAGSTLTLTATASGVGPMRYVWTPNIALTPSPNVATVTVSPTILTKYVVTGLNNFNCSDTASIRVNTISDFSTSITTNRIKDSLCLGDSITLNAVGAPPGSKYVWSPTNYITSPSNTTASINVKPLATTIYSVLVSDSAGCFPKQTQPISIGVGDTARISLGLDTVYLQGGTAYNLFPSIISGGSNGTWAWTPATDLTCSDCQNPTAAVKGNITYQVEYTSIYGCKATDEIAIITFCEASQVFIPNAFTPDGDGINDRFYVAATGISKVLTFRVFNRWGQVVFERANYQPDGFNVVTPNTLTSWDGKFKGTTAPTDVYVYTCEVLCVNGTKFTYTGNVALIK